MSIWCIKPATVTIPLVFTADGDDHPFSITIKKHLTVGEERRVTTAGWRGMNSGRRATSTDEAGAPEILIDWRIQTFARTEAYLVDWTLDDDAHRRLKVDRDTIESLHPDVYALIENAITAHVEAIAEEKKLTNGTSKPLATVA